MDKGINDYFYIDYEQIFARQIPIFRGDNMNFPFANEANTATIVCNHIFEGHEDILYVSHDEDDGMWQFLCGKSNHQENDARIVSLYSVYQLDKTVGLLSNMPCGFYAERKSVADRWFINKNR